MARKHTCRRRVARVTDDTSGTCVFDGCRKSGGVEIRGCAGQESHLYCGSWQFRRETQEEYETRARLCARECVVIGVADHDAWDFLLIELVRLK